MYKKEVEIPSKILINPSSLKGGGGADQTDFAPVLKNMQQRGNIAPGNCKFILSPHFSNTKKKKVGYCQII